MPSRSHSRRAAWLALVSGLFGQAVAFAADAPNVKIKALALASTTPARGATVTATIVGENAGTAPSPHNPLTLLWCGYKDSIQKDAAGKWTVLPSIGNCSQAIMSVVRFAPMAPAATEQLQVQLNAPQFCQAALVVKYKDGKNDFTDPAIAKYTPVYVSGIRPLGEPVLTSSVSVETVKLKKKGTKDRKIRVSYTLEMGTSPASTSNKLVIQVCRANRCFLKLAEGIPQGNFTYSKQKVGNKWVGTHVAKGTFETQHTLESHPFYAGVPNEIRVSFDAAPPPHAVVERRCDDTKVVSYAPLK